VAEIPPDPASPIREVRLRDLRATDVPVVVIGRIVAAQRREVTRRSDGGRIPVLSGLLSDGTATVRFTWWDPPTEEIDRGTVLRAGPVQVREYRGKAEISFNGRTRVTPASDSELPELGPEELELRRVAQLSDGDEGFRLDARVGRVAVRTVTVGEERRQIHEGVLFDGTGTVAFTAWSDFGLREGEAIRVVGGLVRSFRGRPELTLDERSHVERPPTSELPSLGDWEAKPPMPISTLEAARGGESVTVEGRVLAVVPPSGVIFRCPSCQRTLREGLCRTHGAVTGLADLRLRLSLDDGTGAATVNLDRPQTERFSGVTLEAAQALLANRGDPTAVEDRLFDSSFGRRMRVRGRATSDDFGVTLYPDSIEPARARGEPAAGLRLRLLGGRA
jgi:replication factor A1